MGPTTAQSDRTWILAGMAECCVELGYEKTSIADVCAAAGVSRESFERAFADKDECVAAVVESLVVAGRRATEEATPRGKEWPAALRDGANALLETLAERPAFTRVALVEATVAGGRAAELVESARMALLSFLERGAAMDPADVPASAGRAALGGVEALVVGNVLAGKTRRLQTLAPDIVYTLAVPCLGMGEARRLANGAATSRPMRAVA